MANLQPFFKLNNLVLCLTFCSFSMAYAVPIAAYQTMHNCVVDEATLVVRLEQIIHQIEKLKKKGSSSDMINLMLQAKNEVDVYLGKRIDLKHELAKIHTQLQTGGYTPNKKKWDKFVKKILASDDKFNDRKQVIQLALNNGLDFDILDIHELKNEDKEDKDIPIRVVFGITIALCGFFLYCLPMPPVKAWGYDLMQAGVLLAIEGGINEKEKDKDKKDK